MKTYEAIAGALIELGIQELFGLIGDANLFLVNSYLRDHAGHYTAATHEGAAVMMALGYARVTRKTGAATVTHGPALTNTITALVEGVRTATPLVLLAGDTPAGDREHHQRIDQRALIAATGAGFEPLRTPSTAIEDLTRAFYRAALEKRPIVFNMPVEFQQQDCPGQKPRLYFPESRSAIASSVDMDNAIGIIASAHKPVVVAGHGAIAPAAKAAIQRFAERIGAPVATTMRAKGLFADDPFDLGICGTVSHAVALDYLGTSDCMIVFGASLNKFTAGLGSLTRNKRIVHVDPLALHIGRFTPVDAGLVGDPGLTAEAMIDWLDKAEIPSSGCRTDALKAQIADYRVQNRRNPQKPVQGAVDLLELCQTLDRAIPKDRVYVTDSGRFLLGAWPEIGVQRARDYVDTDGFTAIGLGIGAAIGAAKAAEERPTLFVTGDGGLMLSGLSELATIVRERLNMIIVVCNDGCYGMEYVQFTARNMDPALSLLQWPSFSAVAQAFGFQGITVDSRAALQAAIPYLARHTRERPLLIDARLDPAAIPAL